jgi:hypothetical protein
MLMRSRHLVLAAAVALAGCSQKEAAKPATTPGAEAPKPAAGGKGIDNPANDQKLVALAKKVIAECGAKWTDKEMFNQCDGPMKDFREAKLQKLDATCLNFLDDADVKVRYLGQLCLSYFGGDYRGDKALAARLVDALEREKAPSPIDMALGYEATGLWDSAGQNERLGKLLLDPNTSTDVKLVMASWWSAPQGYEAVKTFAASTDPKLLLAAVQGYAVHFSKHGDEACKLWAANLENADKEIRKQAVGHLSGGWSGNNARDTESSWFVTGGGGGPSGSGDAWCPNVDDVLAKTQARIDNKSLDDSVYVYALANLGKHAKATPAQKKKAVALLEKLVMTKGLSERSFAIGKLVEVDPSKKKVIAKLAAEPELKWAVDNALKEKK